MLLIINSTEGRIPKYWRPPFGDVDVRVSDIAREVCYYFHPTFVAYIYIELFLLPFRCSI